MSRTLVRDPINYHKSIEQIDLSPTEVDGAGIAIHAYLYQFVAVTIAKVKVNVGTIAAGKGRSTGYRSMYAPSVTGPAVDEGIVDGTGERIAVEAGPLRASDHPKLILRRVGSS